MRIGLVTGSFLPSVGGLEWKVHFLATEYSRRGHEVTVVHGELPKSHDGPMPLQPLYDIVPVGLRPFPGYGRLGIAEVLFGRKLLAYQRSCRFGILHCHGIDVPTRFAVIVKKRTGIAVVATTSGHDIISCPSIGWNLRSRPYYERMIRDNMCQVDAVGAISQRARRELEKMGATARILDIPNGVDWQRFQCGPSDWLRNRLGLPKSVLTVVSLGRNHSQKGYESGIQAFAQIAARAPDVHYVIAGPRVPALQHTVEEAGLGGRLHLLDGIPMSDVPNLLWSADVFFSPSLVEGFAQVVVQAMACARPCVLSDCPGNEDFRGQPFAVVGKAGNPASLAQALESVVRDANKRREMSVAAHAASHRYAWSVIADEYLNVFRSLVTTNGH